MEKTRLDFAVSEFADKINSLMGNCLAANSSDANNGRSVEQPKPSQPKVNLETPEVKHDT